MFDIKIQSKCKVLVLITLTATWLDLFICHNRWYFSGYILVSWLLIWLLIWMVTKDFWQSVGLVMIVSVFEDYLYLATESLMGIRPWWPVYSHAWVDVSTGGLFGFMGLNWMGLPSSYWIGMVVGIPLVIYCARIYQLQRWLCKNLLAVFGLRKIRNLVITANKPATVDAGSKNRLLSSYRVIETVTGGKK
jgi:hypothetical protein